ncbi:ubiquinol-cytochrome c reductase iron-sulfur subunit [Fervidibacillus albus]|uniref:Menaquinol:cytochrome c reductase iron-sulfur subunit n=1 Tax=Fervidibacillus albus TaxID=2980026 RepID=A0A9E8RXJ9_9BACI|nr:ubiquinol-cytochrome c reductase iron-sulfur subunit [Fervidibacillus albus]WAA11238.1 ubiquinol-cytochrome c reductase iron-sulfur subunit [Fervidibacillus albus]
MGVGGFMAASIVMPNMRFGADPILQPKEGSEFIKTNFKVDDLTTEPQKVDYSFKQKDGWYEEEVTQFAWVYKDKNGDIVAHSPVCKHLGCNVEWNSSESHPDMYFCPCHKGLYYKDGENVPNTPPRAPLDRYDFEVRDGYLYLSTRAKEFKGE